MSRGGEPISATSTKTLAGVILASGYDPTEATVDSAAVEVDVDEKGNPMTTSSVHFKANAGLDPDHYVNQDILFAGLSHNSKHLTERNMFNEMPGCACDPPAPSLEQCSCKAKPISAVADGGNSPC